VERDLRLGLGHARQRLFVVKPNSRFTGLFSPPGYFPAIKEEAKMEYQLFRDGEPIGHFTSRDAARRFLAKARARRYVARLNDVLKPEGVS
jgi:hypothetical protein